MKFETWWRQMKPAEVDEHRAHFEDCWQAATEEAVRKERDACAQIYEAEIERLREALREAMHQATKYDGLDVAKIGPKHWYVIAAEVLRPNNAGLGPLVPERATSGALRECAEWLAYCLSIGWSREQLDALEELWWKHHDRNGRLV